MITESEFQLQARIVCANEKISSRDFDLVTGPGRSGAIAAVYVSHISGIPFLPYKQRVPGKRILVVDTVTCTGKTMKKAKSWYGEDCKKCLTFFVTDSKVPLWYERNCYA